MVFKRKKTSKNRVDFNKYPEEEEDEGEGDLREGEELEQEEEEEQERTRPSPKKVQALKPTVQGVLLNHEERLKDIEAALYRLKSSL